MKRLSVTFVTPSCAMVSGHGSREMLTDLRNRPPVWATLSRAWTCQPSTARDLIAVAESRGYVVDVEHSTVVRGLSTGGADAPPVSCETPQTPASATDGGLW